MKHKVAQKKNKKVATPRNGLAWLVQPVTVETFQKQYFEKQPLHVARKDASFYEGVFGTDDIRRLLEWKEDLRVKEDLNICKVVNGARVDWEAEDDEDGDVDDVLTAEQVWALHDDEQYTMQVFQPQQRCLPLAALMSQLEDTFGSLCGANSYLTPPHSQGLAPHYDDVEVFILQVQGAKRWRLYYPTVELPETYSADFRPHQMPSLRLHSEVLVQQGDMLYFPRGWIHQAVTGDDLPSHHVTLSTYQKHTMKQVLQAAFNRAVEAAALKNVALRKGLPWGVGARFGSMTPHDAHHEAFDGEVADLMTSVLNDLDVAGAIDGLNVAFLRNRLPPAADLRGEAGEERLQQEDSMRQQILMSEFGGDEMEGDDDDEDDDQDSDGENDAQEFGELGNAFTFSPPQEQHPVMSFAEAGAHFMTGTEFNFTLPTGGDQNDDQVEGEGGEEGSSGDEDQDEEGEGEIDPAEFEALLAPSAQVQMVSPSHVTWAAETDPSGEPFLRGYYSVSNFVSVHMNVSAAELQEYFRSDIDLPISLQESVRYLLAHHREYVSTASIPAPSDEDRAKLLVALLTAGLIALKS